MNSENIGNTLNRLTYVAKHALFEQGELAELTYGAFDIAATALQNSEDEEIKFSYPVGYNADKTPIRTTTTYQKSELLSKYQFLAFQQLSINEVVQLVTIIEAMFNDLVRAIVLRYPQKLGTKKTISLKNVLEATTIEEVHLSALDGFLNELSYKSPSEFSESINSLMSIKLMECPAFHKYMEIKACRDVYIHNRGVANEIYVRKAGTHARVRSGWNLPVDIQYFLESYESCLQVVEWLEKELHEHWHSSELEERNKAQLEMNLDKGEEKN